MSTIDFWRECISNAAEDCGLTLTDEQIFVLAAAVEGGHENYSQAFYSPPAGEYLEAENKRLRRELDIESAKVFCKECGGNGRTISFGPVHSANTECWKCRGSGKVIR